MGRPLVVVYRVSAITYWIARALVNVAHVAIVNLLAGREVVPELIQHAMSPTRIAAEVRRLLDDPGARDKQLADLAEVRASLGSTGASARAAEEVLSMLGERGLR
jgi:lipid-A-disaccharide synthase